MPVKAALLTGALLLVWAFCDYRWRTIPPGVLLPSAGIVFLAWLFGSISFSFLGLLVAWFYAFASSLPGGDQKALALAGGLTGPYVVSLGFLGFALIICLMVRSGVMLTERPAFPLFAICLGGSMLISRLLL